MTLRWSGKSEAYATFRYAGYQGNFLREPGSKWRYQDCRGFRTDVQLVTDPNHLGAQNPARDPTPYSNVRSWWMTRNRLLVGDSNLSGRAQTPCDIVIN